MAKSMAMRADTMYKLGSGQKFSALENKLKGQKGVYNPAGLAAAIGRKKYGSTKFAFLGKKGK